jgi:hypothetical protein
MDKDQGSVLILGVKWRLLPIFYFHHTTRV